MAKDLSVDFVVRNNIITIEINYQTKLKFIAKKVEEKNYAKIGRKIESNFKLAPNTRNRTCQAFKSQKTEKLNKTFDSIGFSQSVLRKLIL